MELTIVIIVGVIFCLVGFACVVSVPFGLPGSWIILALALVIELTDSFYRVNADGMTFGWWLLGGCLLLASIGELLELAAGALGAKSAGSSRRGAIGALLGGVVGAIAGIGLPPPVIGSLIGAVVGTFIGAVVGEMHGGGTTVRRTLRPATGATVGRVLGTLSKVPIAAAIWSALSVAAFWP